MKVIIDEDIPYAYELFSSFADIELLAGRCISSRYLKMADALIVRSVTKVNAELLSDTSIRFVGTVTSGIDHIDQNYLLNSSITFSFASGCNSIAVAEYVFSVLLWLAKRDKFFVCDMVVGIVGLGNIGHYLYEKLNFFGVSTLLCDPILEKNNDNMDFCSLEKLVSEADVLTFHVPLVLNHNNQKNITWHMVNHDLLDALSENCILINTSRGSIIDNIALLHILESGKKLRVVLDVWENEPDLLFSLLRYVDLSTPHIAGATFEGKIRGIVQVFDSFKRFLGVSQSNNYTFFPIDPLHRFKIFEDVTQDILFCLSNFVYDVFNDTIKLRCNIRIPGMFDILRRGYFHRREWSSISIESSDYSEKFKNLGFSINGIDSC